MHAKLLQSCPTLCVSLIGRWVLYHWAIREVPSSLVLSNRSSKYKCLNPTIMIWYLSHFLWVRNLKVTWLGIFASGSLLSLNAARYQLGYSHLKVSLELKDPLLGEDSVTKLAYWCWALWRGFGSFSHRPLYVAAWNPDIMLFSTELSEHTHTHTQTQKTKNLSRNCNAIYGIALEITILLCFQPLLFQCGKKLDKILLQGDSTY